MYLVGVCYVKNSLKKNNFYILMVSVAYDQDSRPYITVLLWKDLLLIMNIEICLGFSCKVNCFNFVNTKS